MDLNKYVKERKELVLMCGHSIDESKAPCSWCDLSLTNYCDSYHCECYVQWRKKYGKKK